MKMLGTLLFVLGLMIACMADMIAGSLLAILGLLLFAAAEKRENKPRICEGCGNEVVATSKLCPVCGAKFIHKEKAAPGSWANRS